MIPSAKINRNLKVAENVGTPQFNVSTPRTADEITRDQKVVQNEFANIGTPLIAHQNSYNQKLVLKGVAYVGTLQSTNQNEAKKGGFRKEGITKFARQNPS